MCFDTLLFGVFVLFLWISYQDVRYGKIPNSCLIALSALLLYYLRISDASFWPHLHAGVMGLALIGILFLFRKWTTYVGAGDLKLFAIACFFMTPATLPIFMIASGAIAVVWGIVYKTILKRITFPLGPSLMMGVIATLGWHSNSHDYLP